MLKAARAGLIPANRAFTAADLPHSDTNGKGSDSKSASDLSIVGRENAAALAATFAESRAQFIGELAAAIGASSETVDDSRTVAETLHATATGWKYLSPCREGFREHVAEAAAIILREAR